LLKKFSLFSEGVSLKKKILVFPVFILRNLKKSPEEPVYPNFQETSFHLKKFVITESLKK